MSRENLAEWEIVLDRFGDMYDGGERADDSRAVGDGLSVGNGVGVIGWDGWVQGMGKVLG